MKTKIVILTILASVSLWAVAQNNDTNNNNGAWPDGSTDGAHHHGGKNHNFENTNSASDYGSTNRWRGGTNYWNSSDDGMSGTNRNHWRQKKDEDQTGNPPQN
ncbi:MAG TPA: hypothetical protein VG347_24345 [Verrucomicrobiae bacterium]|nr:hypothetical protein [Verrucomicrobiae bacterium]